MRERDRLEFAMSSRVFPVVVVPDKMMCTLPGGQPELLRGRLCIHDDRRAGLQFHFQNRPAAMALEGKVVF